MYAPRHMDRLVIDNPFTGEVAAERPLADDEMKDAVLDGATLDEADLDFSNLDGCTLRGARIRKAIFPLDALSLEEVQSAVRLGHRLRMQALLDID